MTQGNAMLDLVPRQGVDVEVEVVEGELLIYHPRQARAVYLNSTAAIVWALCDASRPVSEIIRIIGECYPETTANLTGEILATLTELQDSNVLIVG